MVNAQEWLESQEEYNAKEKRAEVKELEIRNKDLEDRLDLSSFVNLESFNCSYNQLTGINISNCKRLKKVRCDFNQLASLDTIGLNELQELSCNGNCIESTENLNFISAKLTFLSIGDNSFSAQELSFLSELVNLKVLNVASNNFFGSLKYLGNLTELEELDISNTDIDNGLEYLPKNLRVFKCSVDQRFKAKVGKLYEQLLVCGWNLNLWKEIHLGLNNNFGEKSKGVCPVLVVPNQLLSKENNKLKENYDLEKVSYQGFALRDKHPFSWEVDWDELSLPKRLPTKIYNVEKDKVEWTQSISDIKSYAILSYVWGGDFNKKTGELSVGGKKALVKAIQACKLFGINYLWMDQLCINPYNFKEQNQEVPRIYQHYDNAEVSLISINVNAGSDKEKIEKSGLVVHLLKKIVCSEWFSSPWTFQEGLLSKQMVFMFDDCLIDGRVMAQVWIALQQPENYGKLNSELRTFATPLGWTYRYNSNNSRDKVSLRLFEALSAVKDRKRTIPVDGIYSILGLLPYGEQVKPRYKSRICIKCPEKKETENCQHSNEDKQLPIYVKEELEEVLTDVMKLAVKNGYAEPLAWFGPRRNKPNLCWIPELDDNGSISGVSDIIRGEEQYVKYDLGNVNFTESQVKLTGFYHLIDAIERFEEDDNDSLSVYKITVITDDGNYFLLSGIRKTLTLLKEGDVLVVPLQSQIGELLSILIPGKNNIHCSIEVIKIEKLLVRKVNNKLKFSKPVEEELIIDMVNKEVIELEKVNKKLEEIRYKNRLTSKMEEKLKIILKTQKQLIEASLKESDQEKISFIKKQLEKTKEEIEGYITLEEISFLIQTQKEITKSKIKFEKNLLTNSKTEENQQKKFQIQIDPKKI